MNTEPNRATRRSLKRAAAMAQREAIITERRGRPDDTPLKSHRAKRIRAKRRAVAAARRAAR